MGVTIHNTDGSTFITVIGVYLPFFDTSSTEKKLRNIKEYKSCLDRIQSLYEEYSRNGPVLILGDTNCRLPKSAESLPNNWYNKKGFNKNSLLMQTFMEHNEIITAEFQLPQPIGYTYYHTTLNNKTHIDHILINRDYAHIMEKCEIIQNNGINEGMHLPIVCAIKSLTMAKINNGEPMVSYSDKFSKINFGNCVFNFIRFRLIVDVF